MTVFRWIFAGVVVALIGLMALQSLRPKALPPTSVQTQVVARSTITRTVSGAGKLEPVHKVNVSSNITGTLLELKVGIGSKVKVGDILCQIDTSRYKAQFEQQVAQVRSSAADSARAKENLAFLDREAKRVERLAASGLASEQEVTKSLSNVTVAHSELAGAQSRSSMSKAALDEAQSALSWATIKAPIEGTVLAVNHRVGERVRGSDFEEDVILVIGSLSEVDVRLEVGEHDVVYIKPGQHATLELDAFAGQSFEGRVIESGRDAIVRNQGTENEVTTFPVWVTLVSPPERALSGMSAQVTIDTETREDVIAVPIASVAVRAPDESTPGKTAQTAPVANVANSPSPSSGGATPDGASKPVEKSPSKAAPGKTAEAADSPKSTGTEENKTANNPEPSPTKTASGPARNKADKVVFVVESGVVKKRVVELGLASDSSVEILKGLSPGEEIVVGPYRTLARDLKDGQPVHTEIANP